MKQTFYKVFEIIGKASQSFWEIFKFSQKLYAKGGCFPIKILKFSQKSYAKVYCIPIKQQMSNLLFDNLVWIVLWCDIFHRK